MVVILYFFWTMNSQPKSWIGGSNIFILTPKIVEDEPILTHIFQRGWFNHQLATYRSYNFMVSNSPK